MSDRKNKKESMSVQVAKNAHQIQTEWYKHSRPMPLGNVKYFDVKCPVCRCHGVPEADNKGVKIHHAGRIAVCRMAEQDAAAFSTDVRWIRFNGAFRAATDAYRDR